MIENQQTKKSYNPFKMWGSWVGVIISFILIYADRLYSQKVNSNINVGFEKAGMFERLLGIFIHIGGDEGMRIMLIVVIMTPIVFFLLGWAIHSLVRRLRK